MTQIDDLNYHNDKTDEKLVKVLEEINVTSFLDHWGPANVIQVYDPELNMQGYLIIDNTALGPALGDLEISPHITPHNVFLQARRMTWSCALMDVNFGGASAGIRAKPQEKNGIKLIKSFAGKIAPYVPRQYIAAPGSNIGADEMSAFVEEIGDMRGATGKPENLGGIPYEKGVIGFGMGVATETSIEVLDSSPNFPKKISDVRIAIQGFDTIGTTYAKYLFNKGAKIVGISDNWSAIYNHKGIDIDKIMNYSSAINEKHSLKCCKDVEKLKRKDIAGIDCDVFATTTEGQIIHKDNISDLKAKLVIEGLNRPVTASADQILYKKRVIVLPDILTTAGGVISSYSEYTQRSSEMAFSSIESKIQEKTRQVIQGFLESDIPLRRVAKEIAKEKILQAVEAKG
jgi:glutamate dehydrogenase (NAD(P)+)